MRTALLLVDVADLEQRVDEEAQADLGRQPAGGRVRGEDQPAFLERLHDVADRGRRQRRRQQPRQVARAQRLAGGEIALDDATEDVERALIEAAQRPGVAQGLRGQLQRRAHSPTLRPVSILASRAPIGPLNLFQLIERKGEGVWREGRYEALACGQLADRRVAGSARIKVAMNDPA